MIEQEHVPHMTRHEQSDKSTKSDGGGISNRNEAVVHDRAGLYIGIVALVISSISLGGVFMYLGMSDKLIEARIEAGAAKAEAQANEARINSRVALDKVEDVRTKLAEKGIHLTLNGH